MYDSEWFNRYPRASPYLLQRALRVPTALTSASRRGPLVRVARGYLSSEQDGQEGEAPSGFAGGGGDLSPYSIAHRFPWFPAAPTMTWCRLLYDIGNSPSSLGDEGARVGAPPSHGNPYRCGPRSVLDEQHSQAQPDSDRAESAAWPHPQPRAQLPTEPPNRLSLGPCPPQASSTARHRITPGATRIHLCFFHSQPTSSWRVEKSPYHPFLLPQSIWVWRDERTPLNSNAKF